MKMNLKVLKAAARNGGLPLFSIVKNERYFLPHLLDHYRALGIGHFLFYDDTSTDGGREFLMEQPDCTILTSGHHFQEIMTNGRPFHYVARMAIPEHFAKGRWCLTVDADEFLMLPERFRSLPALIEELDRRQHICVLAPMVDFHPRRLSERNYAFELGPFEGCEWWFDRDAGFQRNAETGKIDPLPRGVRVRMLVALAQRFPERYARLFPEELVPKGQFRYSKLWKVPLLKTGKGIDRIDTHSVNVPTPADIQIGLAHFKFFPNTDEKVREALATKSYYKQSIEYRFLEAALECLGEEDLVSPRSVKYESPKSLEEAGLIYA